MKKRTVISFFLLVSLSYVVVAQDIRGKAIYSINVDALYKFSVESSSDKNVINYNKKIALAAKDVRLELLFNGNASYFKLQKMMPIKDNDPFHYMASVIGSPGTFYVNKKEGIILQKKKQYVIAHSPKSLDWELTKETQKIGRYVCYKAMLKDSNKNIIAWYAPEIPVSFGPKQYGNLPGLILELNEKGFIYHCHTITLNPKEKIIIKRPEGEMISKAEYDQIGKQQLNDFKSTLKKQR